VNGSRFASEPASLSARESQIPELPRRDLNKLPNLAHTARVRDRGRLAHMNHSCVELRVVGSEHGGLPPMRGPGGCVLQAGRQVRVAGQVVDNGLGGRALRVVVSCRGRRLCGSVAGSA
jgi:hypothetical protein